MDSKELLLQKAKEAKLHAYAPYSKYHVGASILSEANNIYSSCNVENVSFPCGVCAEAGAISAMISNGDRVIKKILITSDGAELVYPCGACLQRIAEFSTQETMIYLANSNQVVKEYKLADLLPHNFSFEELK